MTRSPSLRAIVMRKMLGLMRRHFAVMSLEETRRLGAGAAFSLPRGSTVRPAEGIDGQWVDCCGAAQQRVILFLHGGGYIQRTPKVHHALLARLGRASDCRGLYVDYRLAPEHPFPAALEDSVSAYRWLIDGGFAASNIFLVGDSAGAGLALATMVELRALRAALPSASALLSPMCELTLTSPRALADTDPIYAREAFVRAALLYAAGTPLDDPRVSAINADLSGLPPMLIQAGEVELFRDDAITLASRVHDCGGRADLSIYPGLWHDWQVYPRMVVPESEIAIQEVGAFIRSFSSSAAGRH